MQDGNSLSHIAIKIAVVLVLVVGLDEAQAQTDDELIQARIDAAGEGATVILDASSEYLICRPLRPLKDQTIDVNGSTLKKCDEKVTGVQSYEGDGVWLVDDASAFEIGEWLTVSSTGGYDRTTGWMVIQEIDGNRIRAIAPIEEPLDNLTMTTDSPIFYMRQPGVTLQNFILDGNYENNDTIIKWDTSILVIVSARDIKVQNGQASEIPGDLIQFAIDSDNSEVRNVEAQGGAGAFVHLTGIGLNGDKGIRILDNTISDFGREHLRQEHAFGAIEWSDNVGNVLVEGNHFHDLPFAAINMRDDQLGESAIVRNNTALRTNGFVYVWKYEYDPNGIRQLTEIEGNTLFDTKGSTVQVVKLDEPIARIRIAKNVSENGYWDISGIEELEFSENEIVVSDMSAAGIQGSFDQDESPALLSLGAIKDAQVHGNYFEGSWRHLKFENRGIVDDFLFEDEYTISDNRFVDFLFSGIEGSLGRNAVGDVNEKVKWTTENNILKSTVLGQGTDLNPSGIGVVYSAGGHHQQNCIQIDSPRDETFAARVFGISTEGLEGEGGIFESNLFLNSEGQSVEWGVLSQDKSLVARGNTISDNVPLNLVSSPTSHDTMVDPNADCGSIETRTVDFDINENISLSPVYPNPSRDWINLQVAVKENSYVKIELFSIEGKRVVDVYEGLVLRGLPMKMEVDVSGLAGGVYLLRSQIEDTSSRSRMISIIR